IQAENLQRLRECIKSLPFPFDQCGYLSGLQLNTRDLRFSSDRSRLATAHQQQVTPLDYSDSGMTQIEPLLLRFGRRFVSTVFVDNGSHCFPKDVRGWIDD